MCVVIIDLDLVSSKCVAKLFRPTIQVFVRTGRVRALRQTCARARRDRHRFIRESNVRFQFALATWQTKLQSCVPVTERARHRISATVMLGSGTDQSVVCQFAVRSMLPTLQCVRVTERVFHHNGARVYQDTTVQSANCPSATASCRIRHKSAPDTASVWHQTRVIASRATLTQTVQSPHALE